MSSRLARRKLDPHAERARLWVLSASERRIHVRISLRFLSQAIAQGEPTQMIANTKAALLALGNVCHGLGYGALACICSDMHERMEDVAGGFPEPRSLDLFRRWLRYVDDYLDSPLRRQSVSAMINTQRLIWSYAPLSRCDRVLLVRALRCAGR